MITWAIISITFYFIAVMRVLWMAAIQKKESDFGGWFNGIIVINIIVLFAVLLIQKYIIQG